MADATQTPDQTSAATPAPTATDSASAGTTTAPAATSTDSKPAATDNKAASAPADAAPADNSASTTPPPASQPAPAAAPAQDTAKSADTAPAAPATQAPASTAPAAPAANAAASSADAPVDEAPVIAIPEPSADDIAVGKGLAVNSVVADRVESALGLLREPGISTDQMVAQAQHTLFIAISQHLTSLAEIETQYFLDKFMQYAVNHLEGHFSSKRLFQGLNELRLPAEELNEFKQVLRLLVDVADPTTRLANAKAVNWKNFVDNLRPKYADVISLRLKRFLNLV